MNSGSLSRAGIDAPFDWFGRRIFPILLVVDVVGSPLLLYYARPFAALLLCSASVGVVVLGVAAAAWRGEV